MACTGPEMDLEDLTFHVESRHFVAAAAGASSTPTLCGGGAAGQSCSPVSVADTLEVLSKKCSGGVPTVPEMPSLPSMGDDDARTHGDSSLGTPGHAHSGAAAQPAASEAASIYGSAYTPFSHHHLASSAHSACDCGLRPMDGAVSCAHPIHHYSHHPPARVCMLRLTLPSRNLKLTW